MNLSQRFHQYLKKNQIYEFTTREALSWYDSQRRPGLKRADTSSLSFLILKPLILEQKIRRLWVGQYQVINRSSSEPLIEPLTEPPSPTEPCRVEPCSEEDKEFFKYLESKAKKGGLQNG